MSNLNFKLTPGATVHVSPHLLMDVISCKTRAWVRHAKGFTSHGEAIKAVAGQAMHAGIAAYLDPRHAELDPVALRARAVDAFTAIFEPAWGRMPPEQMEPSLVPANLRKILQRWMELRPPGVLPWARVEAVEEAFVSREWLVFAQGAPVTVKLIVRPDAVVVDHDGYIRYLDTKTTGWRISDPSWMKALRLSTQTALYADAVRQRYGERAVLGGWINAMELRKLPGEDEGAPTRMKANGEPAAPRKCAEHKTPYAVCGSEHAKAALIECMTTEESVAQVLLDAERAAGDFVRLLLHAPEGEQLVLPQEGRANEKCRFCVASEWCDANRYIAALDSMLVFNEWPIEEGYRE